jgi:hypothetical protein
MENNAAIQSDLRLVSVTIAATRIVGRRRCGTGMAPRRSLGASQGYVITWDFGAEESAVGNRAPTGMAGEPLGEFECNSFLIASRLLI